MTKLELAEAVLEVLVRGHLKLDSLEELQFTKLSTPDVRQLEHAEACIANARYTGSYAFEIDACVQVIEALRLVLDGAPTLG